MLLARRKSVSFGQGAAIVRDPCGLRPSHLVEDLDLHILRLDIFTLSAPLLVSLTKDSVLLVLCRPCAHCLGSEVWLLTKLRRWRWLTWLSWLFFLWLVVPTPIICSPHQDLMDEHACFGGLDPFVPPYHSCFGDLPQDGKCAVHQETGSNSLRPGVKIHYHI